MFDFESLHLKSVGLLVGQKVVNQDRFQYFVPAYVQGSYFTFLAADWKNKPQATV